MKLLILEFICGGCWEDPELPPSLHKEGWLMLHALLEDASKIPNYEIYTTWDARLGEFPLSGINVTTISRPEDFKSAYAQLLDSVDQVLIIAPEFKNHLYNLVFKAYDSGRKIIGSMCSAIKITSNKMDTKEILRRYNIPTIKDYVYEYPEDYLDNELDDEDREKFYPPFPYVVKPVDGAGSLDVYCFQNAADYDAEREYTLKSYGISEQFVAGQHFSMGVIVNRAGHVDYLPLAAQHIEIARKITYLGGHLPVENIDQQPFQQLAERCLKVIPGLFGYFGIDMILPDDNPQQPIVVEINPRLTTSYVGYRQFTTTNLLKRMLSQDTSPPDISWENKTISWNTSH